MEPAPEPSLRTAIARAAPLIAAGAWLAACAATLVIAAALGERAGGDLLLRWMWILAYPASYLAIGVAAVAAFVGKFILGIGAGAWMGFVLLWLCFLAFGYLQWCVLVPKLARALRRRSGAPTSPPTARRPVRRLVAAALVLGIGGSAFTARGAAYFCPAAWGGAPIASAAERSRALGDIAERERAKGPVLLVSARTVERRRDAVVEAWTVAIDGRERPYTIHVTLRQDGALCRPSFWFAMRGHPTAIR